MSDEVHRIASEIMGTRSDLRALPIARLVEMAEDSETTSDSSAALLKLCEQNFIGRDNLLPHEHTLLALCGQALNEARPAQEDPRQMGWLADSAYSPIRYRTGLLLDIAGYLRMENAEPVLRAAFLQEQAYGGLKPATKRRLRDLAGSFEKNPKKAGAMLSKSQELSLAQGWSAYGMVKGIRLLSASRGLSTEMSATGAFLRSHG